MSKQRSNANQMRKQKIRQAIDFIEELSWLLESKKSLDLKNVPNLLREAIGTDSDLDAVAGQYASPDPNKHFLIGVLPRLFQDQKLFPTNEDIADFGRSVLNLAVTRYDKRSKYELIGLIVCETNNLNDEGLSDLVRALANITGSRDKIDRIIQAKKEGSFSWNEAIQRIGRSDQNEPRE